MNNFKDIKYKIMTLLRTIKVSSLRLEMILIITLTSIIYIFYPLDTFAQKSQKSHNIKDMSFTQRWMSSPLYKSNNNINSFKIFKRFTSINGKIYTIGSLSTFFYHSIHHANLNNIKHKIVSNLKNIAFKTKIQHSLLSLDGTWKKMNRKVKYLISFKGENGLFISIATYRMGYEDSILPEINILQTELLQYFKLKEKISFINLLQESFLPSVFAAQASVPPSQIANLTNSMSNLTRFFANISANSTRGGNSFNRQSNITNTNWRATNSQLQTANQNIATTNNQLKVANQNIANTNKIVDKNWTKTNRIIDTNSQAMTKQATRTNDLIQKMTQPKTVFTLAIASAAGAVLGASVASLVLDGIVNAGSAVVEFFRDSKGKEDRWKKFQKAISIWEDLNSKVAKAEASLDYFLLSGKIMRALQNNLPPEKQNSLTKEAMLEELSFQQMNLDRSRNILQNQFITTSSYKCRRIISNQLFQIKKKIKYFTNIVKVLNQQEYQKFDNDAFCERLQSIIGQFANAEAAIQRYRLQILAGRNEWQDEIDRQSNQLYGSNQRNNSIKYKKSYRDKEIAMAKLAHQRLLKEVRLNKRNYKKRCKYDEYNHKVSFKQRLNCLKHYRLIIREQEQTRIENSLNIMNKRIARAKQHFAYSSNKFFNVDNNIENDSLMSYYNFFDKLEHQIACKSRVEKNCSKFLKKIKILNQAKQNFKQFCTPNYELFN